MREQKRVLSIDLNYRERARKYSQHGGKGVSSARAERTDRAIQAAVTNCLPIRVVINEGKMRNADDPNAKASQVRYRLLDSVPWAVTLYDWKTGECTLTRGALVARFADQFSVQLELDTAQRRMASGMVFIRDPTLRARALERAKGACEYCGKAGFSMTDARVFLETHHVIPLSENGTDTEDNVVAICPNHHREAHHGKRAAEIRQTLLDQLRRLLFDRS